MQQRDHNRWPRHHQDRADQGSCTRAHIEEQCRRTPADQPGDERPDRDEAQNNRTALGESVELEAEPTLIEEQPDGQTNDGEQDLASEVLLRIHDIKDGTDKDSSGEQEQHTGNAESVRQPLAAHAKAQNDADRQRQLTLVGEKPNAWNLKKRLTHQVRLTKVGHDRGMVARLFSLAGVPVDENAVGSRRHALRPEM